MPPRLGQFREHGHPEDPVVLSGHNGIQPRPADLPGFQAAADGEREAADGLAGLDGDVIGQRLGEREAVDFVPVHNGPDAVLRTPRLAANLPGHNSYS